MPTSIPEQIATNLISAANAVTTGNGYTVTLTANRMETARDPETRADLAAFLHTGKIELQSHQTGKTMWLGHFQFAVYLDQAGDTTTTLDSRIHQAGSALAKGIMAAPQRGTFTNSLGADTGNPLAVDTLIESIEPFPPDSGYEGFTLFFRVQFRTAAFDLYNQ